MFCNKVFIFFSVGNTTSRLVLVGIVELRTGRVRSSQKEGRKDTSPKLFKDSISQNETGPSQKM